MVEQGKDAVTVFHRNGFVGFEHAIEIYGKFLMVAGVSREISMGSMC